MSTNELGFGRIPHALANTWSMGRSALVGVFLLTIAIVAWRLQPETFRSGPPLIIVSTLTFVGVYFVLAQIYRPSFFESIKWLAPIVPLFAAIGGIGAYLSGLTISASEAVFYGFLGAVVAWFLLAMVSFDRTSARGAQERAYSELQVRIKQLEGRLHAMRGPHGTPAYNETEAALHEAERYMLDPDPGSRWTSAMGYVSTWRMIHRCEESLIHIDDKSAVVASALTDDLRLDGSVIPGRDRLAGYLREGVAELDPVAAERYLKVQRPDSAEAAAAISAGDSTALEFRSRAMLREVRRAINDFRDARTEDIVRNRNILRRTFGLAAVVSYALVAVAIMQEVGPIVVATASGLFLIAALVGLFSRLRNASVAQSTVDDFGLYEAQLLAAPLVSGIAGIGGVVLVAAAPIAAAALGTVGTTSASQTAATLNFEHIFNLSMNPLAVIFAAVFGLTPDLLLNRLQAETDRIKKDIRSSYVADKAGRRGDDAAQG